MSVVINNSDDDSNDEFPLLYCLLSPEYRYKLVEERAIIQERTAKKNLSEALDDLFGYRLIASTSLGRCTELLRLNACLQCYR